MKRKKYCTQCGKPFSSAACGYTHWATRSRMKQERQVKQKTGWVLSVQSRSLSPMNYLAVTHDGAFDVLPHYSVYYRKSVAAREAKAARRIGWDVKMVKVTVTPEGGK